MMNEIFLLVGGEATRLQPLSSGIPKALLTIRGEKIIDKIITQFSKFSDFTFNLICSEKHRQHYAGRADVSRQCLGVGVKRARRRF